MNWLLESNDFLDNINPTVTVIIYQYIIDSFKGSPFWIQLAVIIIMMMIIGIISLIISLKSIRSFLETKDKEILKYRNEYEVLLIEYLYSGSEKEKLSDVQQSIILKLKRDIEVTSRRKSVISILNNLMNEVSGEMSDSIKTLYHQTGLIDYAILRLKSKKWHVISKAIGELTRFKIYETHDVVAAFINHPRVEVHKEAQLYLVHLFKFKGLSFLDDLKLPLSEWHQLLLLESLMDFDDLQIGDIKPWLKSSNVSVVLFALKLSKIYNQFEVKNVLIELLSHSDKTIRVSAMDVLDQLFGYEVAQLQTTHCDDLSNMSQIPFVAHLE